MRIYRISQSGDEEEHIVADDEIYEAVPVDEDEEWAYSITEDDTAAAWLADIRKRGMTGDRDDETIREMVERYLADPNLPDLAWISDLDRLYEVIGESSEEIISRDQRSGIVAGKILEDAVDRGLVSDDTARRVTNSKMGVMPTGKITPTGRAFTRDEVLPDNRTQTEYHEEVVDEMGYSFIKNTHRLINEDGSSLYQSDSIVSIDSDRSGVTVGIGETSYSHSGRGWIITVACNDPSKAERRIMDKVSSVIDGMYSAGIEKFNTAVQNGEKPSKYPDAVQRHENHSSYSSLIIWQGRGDEVPDITDKVRGMGDMEGVKIISFDEDKKMSGDKIHRGFDMILTPTFDDGKEDYEDMMTTLSRIKEDGSAIRIIEAFPPAVHTMVHKGKLGIWDSEEKWAEYGSAGAKAVIISSYGNRKFRIAIKPDLDTKGTGKMQTLCHELGHFIFNYMISGSDPWIKKESMGEATPKTMAEEWEEWYKSTGVRMDDIANEFVQSEYPESLWNTEYFAEVASVFLMRTNDVSELSGEKPAIDPESYRVVSEMIRSLKIIPSYSRKRPYGYSESYEKDGDPQVIDRDSKMADYGKRLEAPKEYANRKRLEAETWMEKAMREAGLSRMRTATENPLSMSKKEWMERGMDVDWSGNYTNDEWSKIFWIRSSRDKEWSSAMAVAISMGEIDPKVAKSMGFSGPPEPIVRMPSVLYHVTTAASSVLSEGLKTRGELSSPSGLGGGPENTISFTESLETANDIHSAIMEARGLSSGELSIRDMIDMARRGEGADRPWIDDLERAKKLKVYDTTVEEAVETGEFRRITKSPLTVPQSEFLFFGDSRTWVPTDSPDENGGHSIWTSRLSEDEINDIKVSFYKYWATFREDAGGNMYPLFWGDSMKGLATIDQSEIAIVRCNMREGSMGYKMNALGEWRTWTGKTVESMEIVPPGE